MKLPNFESALVQEGKITGYLLSTTHRDGRHKAAFFLGFGFATGDWQTLAKALLSHASEHEVAKAESTPFGTRYVVEGTISNTERQDTKHPFGVVRREQRGYTAIRHCVSARRSRQ